ncbi:unnamed protein product [Rhizophagus irregularis]|nr:unnamed protein product [Rhizophagus irregularis]
MVTYFWISDNWDEFDFWAVDLYTFIASIFLVIVLQNMLIAYMSGLYEEIKTNFIKISSKFHSEALHHIHFSNPEAEPIYIYHLGQPKNFEEWERNYDEFSIWKYDDDNIKARIENFKNIDHYRLFNYLQVIVIKTYEILFLFLMRLLRPKSDILIES